MNGEFKIYNFRLKQLSKESKRCFGMFSKEPDCNQYDKLGEGESLFENEL